jgi:CheY-like chemotaxis protein
MKIRSILVVDDDRTTLSAMNQMLRPLGYVVTFAVDGRDAIDSLNRESVDLVITDILMSDMDGFELIAALRKNFPDIPVVAISGGANLGADTYLMIAKGLGSAGVLRKPVTREELVLTINGIETGSLRAPWHGKPMADWKVVGRGSSHQEAYPAGNRAIGSIVF